MKLRFRTFEIFHKGKKIDEVKALFKRDVWELIKDDFTHNVFGTKEKFFKKDLKITEL